MMYELVVWDIDEDDGEDFRSRDVITANFTRILQIGGIVSAGDVPALDSMGLRFPLTISKIDYSPHYECELVAHLAQSGSIPR